MFWSIDKEILSGADVIGWNFLFKKKKSLENYIKFK